MSGHQHGSGGRTPLGTALTGALGESNLEGALHAARTHHMRDPAHPTAKRVVEALELLMNEVWVGSEEGDPRYGDARGYLKLAALTDADEIYAEILADNPDAGLARRLWTRTRVVLAAAADAALPPPEAQAPLRVPEEVQHLFEESTRVAGAGELPLDAFEMDDVTAHFKDQVIPAAAFPQPMFQDRVEPRSAEYPEEPTRTLEAGEFELVEEPAVDLAQFRAEVAAQPMPPPPAPPVPARRPEAPTSPAPWITNESHAQVPDEMDEEPAYEPPTAVATGSVIARIVAGDPDFMPKSAPPAPPGPPRGAHGDPLAEAPRPAAAAAPPSLRPDQAAAVPPRPANEMRPAPTGPPSIALGPPPAPTAPPFTPPSFVQSPAPSVPPFTPPSFAQGPPPAPASPPFTPPAFASPPAPQPSAPASPPFTPLAFAPPPAPQPSAPPAALPLYEQTAELPIAGPFTGGAGPPPVPPSGVSPFVSSATPSFSGAPSIPTGSERRVAVTAPMMPRVMMPPMGPPPAPFGPPPLDPARFLASIQASPTFVPEATTEAPVEPTSTEGIAFDDETPPSDTPIHGYETADGGTSDVWEDAPTSNHGAAYDEPEESPETELEPEARAEACVTMGKYEEALMLYQELAGRFPSQGKYWVKINEVTRLMKQAKG